MFNFRPRSALRIVLVLLLVLDSLSSVNAAQLLHSFKKVQVTDKFWAEGANFGDFNHDGKIDVVSGPFWYEGPRFIKRHEFMPANATFTVTNKDGTTETIPGFEGGLGVNNAYSECFFVFTYDFNHDGWDDILIYGFPGKDASWYENPKGREGHWQRHFILEVVDNESPDFMDINGDGKPDILCCSGGCMGFAEADWKHPDAPWTFHAVTPRGKGQQWQKFTHGLGAGDINGDGRVDILDKDGWWEQPKSLAGNPLWKHHPYSFGGGQGGAQMLVYDVNGDGLNDIITSINAHGYGLAWYEQVRKGDEITFQQHIILNTSPVPDRYGVSFSQIHSLALVDIDGDGLMDIVTGKRFWAHGTHGDVAPTDPPYLYWFQLQRPSKGPNNFPAEFVPHRIDDDSGVGTQVVAGKISNKKFPDIVVGNKKGLFVFEHQTKRVSRKNWLEAQPKPLAATSDQAGGVNGTAAVGGASVPASRSSKNQPAVPALPTGKGRGEGKNMQRVTEGTLPIGKDGKPLNFDFEDGTLKDWTSAGEAFQKQPIRGDTVFPRRSDMRSEHQGNYWIGGYEIAGDNPQGTLTSVPFKVTQPFAAFRVAGGAQAAERVELVQAADQKVIFKTSGYNSENLRPVVVDLTAQVGKDLFIRLVDEDSGGWGHINFDDFRLYAQRPKFPNELTPVKVANEKDLPPMDSIKFAGLSPEDAVKNMTLPPGFKATLFAGEPDVKQPIAFAIDDRGRLWIAEAYTYPIRAPEGQGKDRILVFEDTNGDGKFDKRTVFMEGLNLVSGIEVGFGGVWVGAAPYLMFIPVKDSDEPKPAGPPEILLDGFAYQDTHETLNTFTWGPDGWLYGCHGVFTHSNVGKPGTADDERTKINAGVWRYHPVKQKFEVFAEGTSNPWGIDFDEHGQCIIEACVIPHLFHMIQGGRFQRQAGSHFNPYAYDDIKTIADHVHWSGNGGPHAGNSRSAAAGGGHAHAGLLVYQGENWPEQYRGKIFMNNIHGACINMDVAERQGSGFVGHHGANFIDFNDTWSQILNLQTGPDGSVYMIDWYDKNQCHHNDPNGHDRSNGRIFRISYGDPKWQPVDLQKKTDEELIDLAINNGDWASRHARRILQERAVKDPAVHGKLRPPDEPPGGDPKKKLRWLWAQHVTGGNPTGYALHSANEYVRAWAIQLACEEKQVSTRNLEQFVSLAEHDTSPVVRLYLASAAQRLPVEQRWGIIEKLCAHSEDASDHNLSLMVWYAAEPLTTLDIERALKIAEGAKLPDILNFTVRRTTALGTPAAFAAITRTLLQVTEDPKRLDILSGLSFALKGQRKAAMPDGWETVEQKLGASSNPDIRAQVQSLSLTFGSPGAVAALKKTLMDKSAEPPARKTVFESLLNAKDPGLPAVLQGLLSDPLMQGSALRGLASYDDPKTPAAILEVYPSLNEQHKRDALTTLASRLTFARPLVSAISAGTVPKQDLSAALVRQLHNLKNGELDTQLDKVWGVMRETSGDKQKEIARYKQIFLAGGSQPGDASRGRAVFAKTCQQCHILFDTGGKVGPDLTGSNRGDLDYLLQNIVDPNAVIPNDYKAWNLETKDDRSVSGILKQQDEKSVTIVTANETLVIPRNEIQSLRESALSMMPEGLLQNLPDQEIRDLLYYLRGPAQAPMPPPMATTAGSPLPDSVSSSSSNLFNGADLSNWEGDMSLWSVENGEIVGRTTTGLKHNEFLKSKAQFDDFRLVLKMKLVPNSANSGIQFRSERFGEYEMKGPQADAGLGWWGKLYEENGRALLSNKPGDEFVKTNDWNTYEVIAVGNKVRTALNGHICVDLDDPQVSRRGIFGLQVHAGGPTEVRFKDINLELNPKLDFTTAGARIER